MEGDDRLVFQPNSFLCGAGGIDQLHVSWGRNLLDPLRRNWAGEQAVLQQVVCDGRPARVVVGGANFGKIIPVDIHPDMPFVCQKGAFLAATGEVEVTVAFTRRLRAGIFGRQGSVFQRLTGNGRAFLHAAGTVIDWTIPDEQVVRVSTRNVLGFEASVGYDIQFSGGALTLMFGSQGAFLSQLQGPGRVLVQSVDQDSLFKNITKTPRIFKASERGPGGEG